MKKLVLALCLSYSANSFAGGIPVYSAVEHSQQILTHIEILNDAMVQLEKLGVMDNQLTTQIDQLLTQYEQFDQQIQNARRVYGDLAYVEDIDIINMLDKLTESYDRVQKLDPSNPYYDQTAKDAVYQQYGDPTIRASASLSGNAATISRMDAEGTRIQAGYDDYLAYQKYVAAKNKLATGREAMISRYNKELKGLGDNSSLATQQLTAYQINLLLKQQEELIGSVGEINEREEKREQKQRALELEAYQDKIDTLNRRASTVYRVGGEQ